MLELEQLWSPIVSVILAAFIAWVVTKDKITRHQCDELMREIAKEHVKPFKGSLQLIEDEWHTTFERMKLTEQRNAARLKKEERLIAAREEGGDVDRILAGAKPAEAGKNLAESNGSRQSQREDMLKKHLTTRAPTA